MSAERRRRLDEIGFVWDPHESAWEENFAALMKFKAREGHCLVPQGHIEGTYNLGNWVSWQRRPSLSDERRQRLNDIGFVWDVLEAAWEKGFQALKKYKAREGHCAVPRGHIEDSYKLGTWVGKQRHNSDTISDERRQRLDELGFIWDPYEDAWEDGFAALEKYKAREGHCRVPVRHIEGTYKLGMWVFSQRQHKDTMPDHRKRRLDEIGFVWREKPGPK